MNDTVTIQEEINKVLVKHKVSYVDAYSILQFMSFHIMQELYHGSKQYESKNK